MLAPDISKEEMKVSQEQHKEKPMEEVKAEAKELPAVEKAVQSPVKNAPEAKGAPVLSDVTIGG